MSNFSDGLKPATGEELLLADILDELRALRKERPSPPPEKPDEVRVKEKKR